MKNYFYKCLNCKEEYNSEEIEKNYIYLCPNCGKCEKNKPLEGVLKIEYDYNYIKTKISKQSFLTNKVGSISQYPFLFTLKFNEKGFVGISDLQIEKLTLTENPVSTISIDGEKIKIFDDSRNPTLSYKDRASILVALKAIQLGMKEISAASTGNAGSSLAGICARLGVKSHIFVPKNIPSSKRIQIQSFGANIYVVDGDYDEAFDLCLEVSKKKKWYNRNTAYNPLTIEGKKSAVYDMFIQLKGKLPKNIFVSAGDGVIISGIYKGLWELKQLDWIKKMPRLIMVQAEGSDAIIRYLETEKFEYIPASTIADSISAGAPRNLYMAADAVKKTNGIGVRVSDDEIISAQKILANKGVLTEPAASAVLAGFIKLNSDKNIDLSDSMLMITGNGLKDISSLERWNIIPEIKSYDKWKNDLL